MTTITETSRDELIVLGSGLRAQPLIQQAGYTLDTANDDGEAILALLEDGFL